MSEVYDGLAKYSYRRGVPPIDVAIQIAKLAIEVRDEVRASRRRNPRSFPIYSGGLDNEALAGRIVASLLNAGWTPPDVSDLSDPPGEVS